MYTHPPDQLGGTRHCLQEFKYAKNTLFVYFCIHGPPSPPPKEDSTEEKRLLTGKAAARAVERHEVALGAVARAPLRSHSIPSLQVQSDLTTGQQPNLAILRFSSHDNYIYAI